MKYRSPLVVEHWEQISQGRELAFDSRIFIATNQLEEQGCQSWDKISPDCHQIINNSVQYIMTRRTKIQNLIKSDLKKNALEPNCNDN